MTSHRVKGGNYGIDITRGHGGKLINYSWKRVDLFYPYSSRYIARVLYPAQYLRQLVLHYVTPAFKLAKILAKMATGGHVMSHLEMLLQILVRELGRFRIIILIWFNWV